MAAQLPAKLKTTADITRFAQRAAQLEKVKPAIAYWCEYWIVNQLLARGLHNTDAECLQYTTRLMDKLEQTKSKYANDDAIVDDTAGQAYVEQFGLETFERADRTVQANKVTKQTADTFLAASTFLELLNIWGEPDTEIQSKIRYAKWNAVRIVKAIKEGQDPNESNPAPEPTLEPEALLDPNDPEVQQLNGHEPSYPPPPSVQEVADEQDQLSSLHTPTATPLTPTGPARPSSPYEEVSPIERPPPGTARDSTDSIGGGYFPSVPTTVRSPTPPVPPTDIPTNQPPAPSPRTTTASPPRDTRPFASPPAVDFPSPPVPPPTTQSPYQPPKPPGHGDSEYSTPGYTPVPAVAPPIAAVAPARLAQQVQQAPRQKFEPDDVAIAKAQKHARWAISALNFEDADTAVKELRAALETLGA